MRILMLAQFYPPIIGGEERHVRNLSAALARRGHEVTVATLADPDCPPLEREDGVEIHRFHGTLQRAAALFSDPARAHAPPFPDPELTFALGRLVARFEPDIVHAHNWMLHSFLPLKRKSGARLLVTLHDYSLVCAIKSMMFRGALCSGPRGLKCLGCASDHYGAIKGSVTRGALAAFGALERITVDKFLAVSHAVARGNALDRQRVPHEVVPNFIPDEFGSTDDAPDPCIAMLPDRPYILFVGDLTRLKGVHLLLKAYAECEGAPPLVLIGRRCPDTPERLPAGAHVFESWPHAAVIEAWRRCIFGVVPSIWAEPCATVVMEAMSLGKPVIATNVGGMPDMIEDQTSGLLVAPGDEAALAQAMRLLIEKDAVRERLSTGACRRIKSFQAGSVVPRIERIYEHLLIPQRIGAYQLQAGVP